MQAKETNLLKFLNIPKQLMIPIYQRTYSWGIKECEQLWKDIVKTGKNDSVSGHFIGSVVYVEKGLYQASTIPRLLVIDGQQRLTTISLLISALCKVAKENGLEEINPDKLESYYLINDKEDDELKFKLILTKSDKESLFKIISKVDIENLESQRIKENYKFFLEKLSKSDLKKIWEGISKLIIIDVSLDKEKDNPQLIFESLNATGLELTQADLIRNYILMDLEEEAQSILYREYWYEMEKSFGHSEYSQLFDRFMRDYLTIKTGKIPNIRDVYSEFKLYSIDYKKIEELVKDIVKYSKFFVNIVLEREEDKDLRKRFSEIGDLKVDVSYPFILEIYKDYKEEKISKEDLIYMLKIIESYVFRRAIVGIPTNSLNKTFANLHSEIDKENYLESFKAIMVLKDIYKRFPDNNEFKEMFLRKDVYNSRLRNYILRKLENFGRKELVNIESYTIEHIMPQNKNVSDQWKKDLGDKWKEVHDKYLHTIGNLTLTGYNSELSDNSFIKKKSMDGGFADSPIRLNASLAKLDTWNEELILKRANELIDKSFEVWEFPDINEETLRKYAPKEEERKEYTLEDHPHLAEGEEMRPIFEELRKRILNIDSSVKEEILKLYIAYKSITNFVDIIPQKKALRLSLNIDLKDLNDPQNKCIDVSGKGKWGNGNTEIRVHSIEELDYAMDLIKQAFDNVSEGE